MLSERENSQPPRTVKVGSPDNHVSSEEFARDYVMLDDFLVPKADFFEGRYATQGELDALPGGWKDCPPEPCRTLRAELQERREREREHAKRQYRRKEEAAFAKRVEESLAFGVGGVVLAGLGVVVLAVWLIYLAVCLRAQASPSWWPLAVAAGCLLACAVLHAVDARCYHRFQEDLPPFERSPHE